MKYLDVKNSSALLVLQSIMFLIYFDVHVVYTFAVPYFQVYYHLGAYDDSLTYALGAGDLFDVNGHSEYVETIIGKVNYCQYLCVHNY